VHGTQCVKTVPRLILKGSDDGVQYSELPGFWTLSIVWYSRN
jgi:hypothetical protein